MPAYVQRLELKTGKVYKMGNPWPGSSEEDEQHVGPIFYRAEITDSVSIEGSDDIAGSETMPAHYEVWCIPQKLAQQIRNIYSEHGANPEQAAAAIVEIGGVIKRIIYTSMLAEADEVWPAHEAFYAIAERTNELAAGAQEPQAPIQAQPGNGLQQQPSGV